MQTHAMRLLLGRSWRLAAVLLPVAVPALAREMGPVGRISVVGTNAVDFGKYPAYEQRVATYTVRNSGTGVLKIAKVVKTCVCATASCDKEELAPGEQATVRGVVLADSITGAFDKPIYIHSNDPDTPILKLGFKGHAVPLVAVSPRPYMYVAHLKTNTSWRQRFTLTGDSPNLRLGELQVHSTHDCATSLKPVDGHPGAYTLDVSFEPPLTAGRLKCSTQTPVVAPKGHPPVRITVAGKVGDELFVVPYAVSLPLSDAAVKRTFTLRLTGPNVAAIDPARIVWPKDVRIEGITRVQKSRLRFIGVFSPEFLRDLRTRGETTLAIGYPGSAPAKLRCRAGG